MADTKQTANSGDDSQWPLWEVFVQTGSGKNHEHAGTIHAPDETLALQNGRDVYGRREKVTSIWVVKSSNIVASSPSEQGPFFDQSFNTPYRHPQFYNIPNPK